MSGYGSLQTSTLSKSKGGQNKHRKSHPNWNTLNGLATSNVQLSQVLDKTKNKLHQNMEIYGKPNFLVSSKGLVNYEIYHNSLSEMTSKDFVEMSEIHPSESIS